MAVRVLAATALVTMAVLTGGAAGATEVQFSGVLSTGSHQVVIDSVTLLVGGGPTTYVTTGWGGDSAVVDSFDFPPLPAWPMAGFIFSRVNGGPLPVNVAPVMRDTWYEFPLVPPTRPKLLFWGPSGLADEKVGAALAPDLQVFPAVLSGSVLIRASLDAPTGLGVVILDASGRIVRSLTLEPREDRIAATRWRGEDDVGSPVPNGAYFCRLTAGPAAATAKVLVAR